MSGHGSCLSTDDVRVLFVWDFDRTIVLDNTDLLVFERLAPDMIEYVIRPRHSRGDLWTNVMDSALGVLAYDRRVNADNVLSTVASARLPTSTRDALCAIRDCPHAAAAMLSDANSLYIAAVLKEHCLEDVFDAGIFTNPARIVQASNHCKHNITRVTVTPFNDGVAVPHHGCQRCPLNLCKGELLLKLAEKYTRAIVVYVGDGSNDLCAADKVLHPGYVLPRAGFALHKILAKVRLNANVLPWASPEMLYACVNDIIKSESPADP